MGKVTKNLFGGSDSKQRSSSGLDPRFAQAFFDNLDQAQDVADNFRRRRIAGFTGDFRSGADQIRDVAGGQGQAFTSQAANRAADLASFSADRVSPVNSRPAALAQPIRSRPAFQAQAQSAGPAAQTQGSAINRGDIRNVQPGSFLSGNIGQFLNPVTDNVVDVALNDLNRARQITQQGNADAAVSAGAFGGDRQGVVEGETNRGFADAFARTSAGLRQGAFDRATALQQSDFDRQLAAGRANQGQDAAVAGQNAGFAQQAGLANQQAINARSRLNAGFGQQAELANQGASNARRQFEDTLGQQAGLANQQAINARRQFEDTLGQQAGLANQSASLQEGQLQLGAASRLGALGFQSQQLGLQGAQALQNLGLAQQSLSQERLDAIRNAELERQQIRNQALGLNPGGGAGATSTSRSSSNSRDGIFGSIDAGSAAAGAIALLSDRRLKTDIRPTEGALDKIRALNGYDYRYTDSDKPIGGVMADEVKFTVPEAHGVHISGFDVVDYAVLTGQLIEAVKTLADRIETLEAR